MVELRWEGVESLPIDELRQVVRTEAGSEWAPWARELLLPRDVLEADVQRIEALYRQRGYFGAQARYELRAAGREDRVSVRFRVAEGEPVRVSERNVTLDSPEGSELSETARRELLDDLPLEPGEVFDADRYGSAREQLLARLSARGYLGAALEGGAVVDPQEYRARVDWQVQTGPLVRQGPLEITGLERVDEALIRSTLAPEPGSPVGSQWLRERQERLLDLGLFRWATVQPVPPTGEVAAGVSPIWPIAVRVSERPPRTVTLGFGYATDEGLRGRAAWEHRNLLGRGRTLRFATRHSKLDSSAEAGIDWRELFLPGLRGEVAATARRQSLQAYDSSELELRLALSSALPSGWQGRFGHRLEISNTSSVSEQTQQVVEEARFISALGLSAERAALDDAANPRRGDSMRVAAELSSLAIGSQVDFARGDLELRAYRPFGESVLAGRLQLGAIVPFGSSSASDVPLTERLFAGGGDSVRGFQYQQLGPLDANGEPLGGTSLLLASAEWRMPLRGRLGGVLFVDGGQLALDPLRFNASDMQYSAGLGLRLATPVGPIRIDYGVRLNAQPGEDRGRLHISVGHTF